MKLHYKKALDILKYDIQQEIDKANEAHKWELYNSLFPFMITKKINMIEFDEFKNLFKSNTKHTKEDKVNKRNMSISEDEALKELNELDTFEVTNTITGCVI